jgi:probable F420-dependent oxidoreductase
MQVGLGIPHVGPALGDAAGLRRFAVGAEELGYASLWCGDRLFTPIDAPPYPGNATQQDMWRGRMARFADPLTVVAALAGVTSRVRFNFSTLNAPLYEPVQLARALTTLDLLTDGRLDLGFGLGWMRDEYDALHLPWSDRGRRLDDLLSFLTAWWTTNPVSFDSSSLGLSLPPTRVDLRPVQAGGPPIWLGGTSEAALRRVGRRAVGWLGFDAVPDDALAWFWAIARQAADEAGRDPDTLRRAIRVNVEPGESTEQIAARLDRVAKTGADEALVEFVFACDTVDEYLDAAERLAAHKSW